MIQHRKSNIGKECLYVLPVKNGEEFIILKVKIIIVFNDCSRIEIIDIIREETGNGYYNYIKETNQHICVSNKFLYPIWNKFKKENNNAKDF